MRKPYIFEEIVDGVAKGKEVNPFGEKPTFYDLWAKYGDYTQYGKALTEQCKNWLQSEQSRKSFVIEWGQIFEFVDIGTKFTAELNADNKLFNIEIL
jgi:hypothetical protein